MWRAVSESLKRAWVVWVSGLYRHLRMHDYEAATVDSLKPLMHIHMGAVRAQTPTGWKGRAARRRCRMP